MTFLKRQNYSYGRIAELGLGLGEHVTLRDSAREPFGVKELFYTLIVM